MPILQGHLRQYSSTHEIKLPDKLRAAEQVCKIMGWDAPTHPQGESKILPVDAGRWPVDEPLMVETEGGRYQVQWDELWRKNFAQA